MGTHTHTHALNSRLVPPAHKPAHTAATRARSYLCLCSASVSLSRGCDAEAEAHYVTAEAQLRRLPEGHPAEALLHSCRGHLHYHHQQQQEEGQGQQGALQHAFEHLVQVRRGAVCVWRRAERHKYERLGWLVASGWVPGGRQGGGRRRKESRDGERWEQEGWPPAGYGREGVARGLRGAGRQCLHVHTCKTACWPSSLASSLIGPVLLLGGAVVHSTANAPPWARLLVAPLPHSCP